MPKIVDNIFLYASTILAMSFFFGLAVNSIAFALFIVAAIVQIIRDKTISKSSFKLLSSNKYFLAGFLFFVIQLLLVIFIANNKEGYDKLRNLLPILIIPLLFYFNKGKINTKFFNFISGAFVIGAIINIVVNSVNAIFRGYIISGKIQSTYFTYDSFAEPFRIQPIYLSIYYLIAIVFLINFFATTKDKTAKTILLGLFFFLFSGMVLLSARMTILISLLVIPLSLFFALKNKKLVAISTLCIYIIFGSIVFFNSNLKDRFLSMNKEVANYSGFKLRKKLWEKSINVIKESPIYGYSLGNYNEELINEYKRTNFRRALRYKYNSHNQYIQTLLVSGIIGFLFFIYLLFGSMPEVLKSKDYIYLLFIVVLSLSAITESIFHRQFGIMFFSFMNFFLFAHMNFNKSLSNSEVS
ncbi:O-antigen ligase family protein [Snuella lapsa]|uniref:O-antigen ligase family protein n=1 Tax=Snuella lapsa TaxID=870481 RepID=UPI0031ECBA93